MRKQHWILLATLWTLTLPALAVTEQQQKMLEQLNQLDQLDHMDLVDGAEKANACIRSHDFTCAENNIAAATKVANTADDRRLLETTRQYLLAERQRVDTETRLQAEEDRRLAEAEARAKAEAQRQREAQAQQPSGGFQYGKAAALLGGSFIGGLDKLPADVQAKIVSGIAKDSMAGQEGIGNFKGAADSSLADLQAQVQANRRAREQQQANARQAEADNNEKLLKAAAASRQAASQPGSSAIATASTATTTPAPASANVNANIGAGNAAPITPNTGDKALDTELAAVTACGSNYDGPNDDPQFDSFCKLAAFDACVHKATGKATYDQDGHNSCKTLRGLMDATSSKYQCHYCPYPY